jgi:hypothetical protein
MEISFTSQFRALRAIAKRTNWVCAPPILREVVRKTRERGQIVGDCSFSSFCRATCDRPRCP